MRIRMSSIKLVELNALRKLKQRLSSEGNTSSKHLKSAERRGLAFKFNTLRGHRDRLRKDSMQWLPQLGFYHGYLVSILGGTEG